ncbi:serum response factor-binding protein 1 isoform X2 [Nerophis ophidion]|uniref:serum response factor-binding protein 1 isoform X2 n=1 Tax=Nerophis ophidion TaxID=159077 RepID=UPI002AE0AB96|nr:serum response factor-binding protein 1 isoform X2 [Nerophis ophidion]
MTSPRGVPQTWRTPAMRQLWLHFECFFSGLYSTTMISPEEKVEKMVPDTEEKWREGAEEEAHVGDGQIDDKKEGDEEAREEAEEEKVNVIDKDVKEKKKVKEANHLKNKRAKKAVRTKGQKQPGQLNLNNEVVYMRKEMKRVRVLLIRKLTRQIAVLKNKKGNEVEIERNQKRAARLLDEIHAMKTLHLDLVTKTALQKTLNFDQVCKNPKSTISDRAVARIASHPQFSKRIEDIKAAVKAFQDERVKLGKQGEKHQKLEKEDGKPSPVKREEKVAEEVEETDDSEEQKRQPSQAPTPRIRPASVKKFEVKEPARKEPRAKCQENKPKLKLTPKTKDGESNSEILDQDKSDGTEAAKPVPKPTLRKQDDNSNSEVSDNSNFDGTVAAKPGPQTKQGDQSDSEISEDDKSDLDVSTVAAKQLLKPTLGKQEDKSDSEVSENSDIDSTVAAKPGPKPTQMKQEDHSDSEISEDDKSDLDDSTVAAKQLLKPTLRKQDDRSDSEISDDEDKPYFDDSTEERFHKQSSQSDSDNDFFVGKVSKFKKKKKEKEGVKVQSEKEETSKPVDKIQSELDELESRLQAKAPKLKTVFCSLSQSKPSRGRGGNSFQGRGKPTSRGNGDGEKHSRFQKEERGTAAPKYSKNPETRRFRPEEATFRGRGRGSNPRQHDRKGGFSHHASQQALHPSWEASKKRKEQQGQILAFQGKKIKFDDDD